MFTGKIDEGVKWLDYNVAGWLHRIDLDKLDLRDSLNCMLSQLAKKHYSIARETYKINTQKCYDCGFISNDNQDILTQQWKEQITKLRETRFPKTKQENIMLKPNVTIDIPEQKKNEPIFPALYRLKANLECIVLLVAPGCGTVIKHPSVVERFGDHNLNWNKDMTNWELLPKGTKITIEI